MITREEERRAREWAWQTARHSGLVLHDDEAANIEVADFGLSRLAQVGAQMLTLEANEWISVKILILGPWQLEPEHRHPPCAAESYPGKTEVLRGQWGTLYHYDELGPATAEAKARPTHEDAVFLTAWRETVIGPGDQLVLPPNTWHWFQAGQQGAVVWKISSRVTDAADEWTDPRIVRRTVICKEKESSHF